MLVLLLVITTQLAGKSRAAPPGSYSTAERYGNSENGMTVTAASTARTGRGVAAVDVNRDGRLEWVAGDVRVQSDALHVYFLSSSNVITSKVTLGRGLNGISLTQLPALAIRFGYSIAAIGNLGGTSQWLAVGAPHYDSVGAINDGAVYLLQLSASATVTSLQQLAHGTAGITSGLVGPGHSSAQFGSAVAFLGDIDGDGEHREIAVGASGHENVGAVAVIWLTSSGTVHKMIQIPSSSSGLALAYPGCAFGTSITRLRRPDATITVAVGAEELATEGTDYGGVYLLELSPGTGEVLQSSIISANLGISEADLQKDAKLGRDVVSLGAIDGSSASTALVVAASGMGSGDGNTQGRLFVVFVSLATGNAVSYIVLGPSLDDWPAGEVSSMASIGGDMVYLGDTTGDGSPGELLMGAPLQADGGALFLVELVSAQEQVAWVADSTMQLVDAIAFGNSATAVGLWRAGDEWQRPVLDPTGANVTTVLPIQLPSSVPVAGAAAFVGGRPCGSTIAAPAAMLEGRAVLCVSPPGGILGAIEDVRVLAGGANYTAYGAVQYGLLRSVGTLRAGNTFVQGQTPVPITGEASNFGSSVSWLSDFDGDGLRGEALMGAERAPPSQAGAVFLAWIAVNDTLQHLALSQDINTVAKIEGEIAVEVMRASTIDSTTGWSSTPPIRAKSYFGCASAPLGDLNGDGYGTEVAVGAHGDDQGGAGAGAVYLLELSHQTGVVVSYAKLYGGLGAMPSADFPAGASFGKSLAVLQHGILLAGAPVHSDSGAVIALSIGPTSKVTSYTVLTNGQGGFPSQIIPGAAHFGAAIACADFDGDGSNEAIIGAPGADDTTGAVVIAWLSTAGSVEYTSHTLLKNGANGVATDLISSAAFFGSAVAARDLDGDGRAEVVVGAPAESRSGLGDGGFFFLRLDAAGKVVAASLAARGYSGVPAVASIAGIGLGESLGFLGDLNGGGQASEALIGAFGMSDDHATTPSVSGGFISGTFGEYVLRDVIQLKENLISVTAISPSVNIPQAGGAIVISGSGFAQGEFTHARIVVQIDGNQLCSGARVNLAGTTITCTAPAGYGVRSVSVNIGPFAVTVDALSLPLQLRYEAPTLGSISGLDPNQLPQSGGVELIINGANLMDFNLIPTAQITLTIGPYTCPALTRKPGGAQIVCDSLPAGSGGPHDVRLRLPGGMVSNALAVTYEPAQLLAVDPAAVVPSLFANASINITGTRFGLVAADVTRIVLGGNDCFDIAWQSPTFVTCRAVSLGGLRNKDIVLWQGSVASVGGEGRLQYPDPPRIVGAVPSVVSPLGGENITFFAANLASSTISNIFIDGRPCLAWTVDDGFQGTCTVPPGVGVDKLATILTAGGIQGVSDRPLISYASPTVVSLDPGFASSDDSKQIDFNITGTNFGSPASTPGGISAASVGQVSCAALVHVSDTLIRCLGMRAPWGNKIVSVTVGGITAARTGLFDFFPAPEITSLVLPPLRSTAGGDTLQILGSGFGSIASVTIGSAACASFTRQSASQIDCVTPAGAGTGLVVRVATAANGADETSNVSGHFAYSPPSVTAAEPSAAGVGHVFAGEPAVSLILTIGNGGVSIAQITDVGVLTESPAFNASCGSVAVLETAGDGQITRIQCSNVSLSAAPTAGDMLLVPFLRVAGQLSETVGAASVRMLGRPEINVISPSTDLPTSGMLGSGPNPNMTSREYPLSVLGSWFGVAGDIVGVTIGGTAADFSYVSSTELQVILIPGVGADVDVLVRNRGGLQSAAGTRQVSYASPRIIGVSPAYFMAGATNETVVIRAEWLGESLEQVDAIGIGGQPCVTDVLTQNSVVCSLVSVIDQAPLPTQAAVTVTVGRQQSNQALIAVVGIPTVQAISPSVVSTLGSGNASVATVALLGTNFGQAPTDVIGVTVGGQPCPRVEWVSGSELKVAVPSGVGRSPGVVVTTRGGLVSSRNDQFGYDQADVVSISPDYALTGNLSLSFDIRGTNMGNSPADVDGITVGGNPCSAAVWHSTSRLSCSGVDASSWQSGEVIVTVGGQTGLRNSLLERYATPTIRAVSPAIAEIGQDILVFGTEFGRSVVDIRSVTIDGEACGSIVHQGPTALQCVMPQPSAARVAAGQLDPNAYGDLDVVVTTAGGLASAAGKVAYPGAGDAPPVAPQHLAGWRHRGSAGQMLLRWSFPTDVPTDNAAAITSFSIETASADAARDPATGSIATALSASVQIAQAAQHETRSNQTVFFFSQAAAQTTPLVVRVQAVNPSGTSPWSNWSGPIAANCEASQFLTSQQDVGAWDCASCPTGAFCGGSDASTVTALDGFWRVPWSPAGIGFAPCPVTAACVGYKAPAASNSSARRLQTGSSSSPGSLTLDEALQQQCADPAIVAVAMTWVVIAVFVVIAALIIGALRTGRSSSEKKKTVIPVVKIVFSHLQTVAIAASFNLSWPDVVLDLFNSMQIASSVSADALSLDCALPDFTRNFNTDGFSIFFARSSVILSSPFILVVIALLFWLLVVPWLRCRCVHCALRTFGLSSDQASVQPAEQSPPAISGAAASASAVVAPGAASARNSRAESRGTSSADEPSKDAKGLAASRTAWGSAKVDEPAGAASGNGVSGSSTAAWIAHSEAAKDGTPGVAVRAAESSQAPAIAASAAALSPLPSGTIHRSHTEMQRMHVKLNVWDKVKLTCIVVGFSVHMSVTKASLALLTCTDIDHEGVVASGTVSAAAAASPLLGRDSCTGRDTSRRLAAELSICCWDTRALAWMYGLGFPGLAVYAFGIPAVTALILWHNKARLNTDARVRTTLGFLFLGFRDGAYYWETVTMARKALIATIAVLLAPSGSATQTYAALFVVFLITTAHILVKPYQQALLNNLELGGLIAAFVTFECGLFLSDPKVGPDAAVTATIGIFLANIVFLAAAAWTVFRASVIDSGFAASVSRRVGKKRSWGGSFADEPAMG